jgi:hypothetical protein
LSFLQLFYYLLIFSQSPIVVEDWYDACEERSRFIHFCLLLLVDIIFGSVRSGPTQ